MSENTYSCAKCTTSLDQEVSLDGRIARKDSCPSCGVDLHSCIQCSFYDTSAYNECHESQAERVVEKDRSNFCDYFSLPAGGATSEERVKAQLNKKQDTIDSLDDLFKK